MRGVSRSVKECSGVLYLIVLGFRDEESLAVISQLHVQTHRLSVHLDVHLETREICLRLELEETFSS